MIKEVLINQVAMMLNFSRHWSQRMEKNKIKHLDL
jgi:hypothetical protein